VTLSEIITGSNVSQVEIARRIGVHPVTVTVWKRSPPRDSMAPAIALAVGQPVEVVLDALRLARAQPTPNPALQKA